MSKPTIVCILGMHRSGTSLVSRMLNVLGVELGPDEHLMKPSSDNPTGHWESLPIAELNEEILKRLGGNWAKTPELAPGWEHRPELDELRKQARELIEADFSGHDLWGFKDPRNSLTLPFWQRILPPMRYVVCLRNPVDVARSLQARREDSVPFAEGVGLWLTYVRAGLAATVGHPRELVFYEDLMADPKPVVRRLARFVGRQKSKSSKAETRLAIRVALTDDLWHHRSPVSNVVDDSALAFHVKALYLALRLSVPSPEAIGTEALDLLGAHAVAAGDRLAQLEARKTHLEKRLAERRDEIERLHAERREHQAEHRAERERLAKARVEQERRLHRLEAELRSAEEELRELERPGDDTEQDAQTLGVPATYDELLGDIRARAQELIPSGATVLVASKGDDSLLRLNGRRGWHFPIAADGGYAGFHPSGDTAAIAQLEALRARGADHLLLPKTTLWWLDHYQGLRRHLEERYVTLIEDSQCAIYRLDAAGRLDVPGPIATLKQIVAGLRINSGRDPSILDWRTDLEIASHLAELPVFVPPDGDDPTLPYLDGTVDIVVLASTDAARGAEARRVASSAVVVVDRESPDTARVEWLAGGAGEWGEDVSVALFPDGDEAAWNATLVAFDETLDAGFAGELIVVGDPGTLEGLSERADAARSRIRPVEAPGGAGLAQRARAAAEASTQSVQVFVTAPAVPLPDWMPPILTLFSRERDPGVVGAKIVSSYGALEEAGGMLATDGSRHRRGEGDTDPDRPEYCFVRRVDFCSPPLLATRRDLFERLEGFNVSVAPADAQVDFSLRAGRSGAHVYYQPQVRVVAIGGDGR